MLRQFKSLNELVEYLAGLEGRIKTLEEENQRLRAAPAPKSPNSLDEHALTKQAASSLPVTNIVHPSFLSRAFAVWGHFFVANLIITLPLVILYWCLLMAVFDQVAQSP